MLSSPHFYSARVVCDLLDVDGCIAAVRKAMLDFSGADAPQPLRTIIKLDEGKLFGMMPGALPAPGPFGAKLISAFAATDRPGGTVHRGLVVLFDYHTGAVTCAVDAAEVTRLRTAAASAVATDVLARPDASRLSIYGCGVQAAAHIHAIARVRRLTEVLVWGRSAATASSFAQRMSAECGLAVRAVADGRAAASGADIICTVTSSQTPVLRGEWVAPGTHVNVVGSSHPGPVEIDHALVLASRYIADSRRSVLAAGSEFLLAKEAGLIDDTHIVAEIGEVLLGRAAGRSDAKQITLYKSLGHVVQDLAAASYVHKRASNRAASDGGDSG